MRQAGFTLLELMVAMALLALLALALGGGLRFGMQAWSRLDASLDRGESVALSQVLLRRTIEQAIPLPAGGPVAGALDFAGGETKLRFVAMLPARAAAPGLNEVTVALAPSEAGEALSLSWRPLAGGAGGDKALLDGIAGGRFSYYGSPEPGRPADWQDSWTNARALPRLVALRLLFRDARILWPPLLIAPAASPDATVPAT